MKEVYDLLADEESKKQYLAHIDCRINLNCQRLPVADTQNQYFPADVIRLSEHETFLDAGSYDGDTLRDFCERTSNKFNKYLALWSLITVNRGEIRKQDPVVKRKKCFRLS